LVIGGLVNERHTERCAQFLQSTSGVEGELARLHHAGPRDQKQRAVQPSFKVTQSHESAAWKPRTSRAAEVRRCSRAAVVASTHQPKTRRRLGPQPARWVARAARLV